MRRVASELHRALLTPLAQEEGKLRCRRNVSKEIVYPCSDVDFEDIMVHVFKWSFLLRNTVNGRIIKQLHTSTPSYSECPQL